MSAKSTTKAAVESLRNKSKMYYIIGKKAPAGATEESQITHYKVATSLEDAKAGVGTMYEKDAFMKMLTKNDTLFAFDPRDERHWKLETAVK